MGSKSTETATDEVTVSLLEQESIMKIFLLRHATPDWSRKDIPYDILPGPALLAHGEAEARALGEFMRSEGLKKVY